MVKVCTKCGIEKDVSEFNKNSRAKDGLFSWCRSCANAQSRKWYHENWVHSLETTKLYQQKNPDKVTQYRLQHREQILQRNKDRYIKGKELVESLKTSCLKCGETRKYLIDFHHIEPSNKSFEVSKGTTGRSHEKVIAEIKKCVCMCRNCHTEYHYLYGNVPENPVESLKEYLGVDDFNEGMSIKRDSCTSGC